MSELSNDGVNRLRCILDEPDLSGTRYRLIKKIDSGGMGAIWLADDTLLGRHIAIKVVAPELAGHQLEERLTQEAKLLAKLEHPGIVPVYDIGQLPDKSVYFAMKYVNGVTLENYARSARSRHSILTTFSKICEAVAFAHSRGVIHRDLKPSNIMIGEFGEVLVMDWGVARLQETGECSPVGESAVGANNPRGSVRNTSEGSVVGTLDYMSPEQARGEISTLSVQTDVYALGAILYFLFALRAPHSGKDTDQIKRRVLSSDREPLRSDLPVDKRLRAIIAKAMALSANDRYGDVLALSSDIGRLSQQEPVEAYPENVIHKLERWVGSNKIIVGMFLAYLIIRIIIFAALRV